MKLNLAKTFVGWEAIDENSKAYHKKGKLGQIYYLEIKKYKDQRNAKLLQKYWVMLSEVVANQENYRTDEDLHHDIKWALDITVVKQNMLTGEMIKEVGSVAFDKMTDNEFDKFYSDAITVILSKVLTGVTESELMERVNSLLRFA